MKNHKAEVALEFAAGLKMTERDFADLAILAADQAGLSTTDQSLFEQLLTAAVESRKHRG